MNPTQKCKTSHHYCQQYKILFIQKISIRVGGYKGWSVCVCLHSIFHIYMFYRGVYFLGQIGYLGVKSILNFQKRNINQENKNIRIFADIMEFLHAFLSENQILNDWHLHVLLLFQDKYIVLLKQLQEPRIPSVYLVSWKILILSSGLQVETQRLHFCE